MRDLHSRKTITLRCGQELLKEHCHVLECSREAIFCAGEKHTYILPGGRGQATRMWEVFVLLKQLIAAGVKNFVSDHPYPHDFRIQVGEWWSYTLPAHCIFRRCDTSFKRGETVFLGLIGGVTDLDWLMHNFEQSFRTPKE